MRARSVSGRQLGLWVICFWAVLGIILPGAAAETPPDPNGTANLLAKVHVDLPAQASTLWRADDGLPAPTARDFADQAARLLVDGENSAGSAVPQVGSRQLKCLAYLARGDGPGRLEVARLAVRQAERLQMAAPIPAMHKGDETSIRTAALALLWTGKALREAAPVGSADFTVATQWSRTGLGQLKTHGYGKNPDIRQACTILVEASGFDEDILGISVSDETFFSELDLDRPDMAEVAACVARQKWLAAREAYVRALVRRFTERPWPDLNFRRTMVDLREADDLCRNVFWLRFHLFERYDFGPKIAWDEAVLNDGESRVWLNGHMWVLSLLNAYRETGDDKYVRHLCRLVNDWHAYSPPTFTGTWIQWRLLEAGRRPSLNWSAMLLDLADHPIFQKECLETLARSMLDHGKYLCMYASSRGNFAQVEASGLICIGLLFPEFKLSPLFQQIGRYRLMRVNEGFFLPDGHQTECSPHYHHLALSAMAVAIRLATFLEKPLPGPLMAQFEKGVEASMHMVYPDRTIPNINDAATWIETEEVFASAGEILGRADFQWLASDGRTGTPPASTSRDFPYAGFCVMRDQWGPDGQMLIFDAGYHGAVHQHEDKLHFVFYAGRRELIGDPGIYSYCWGPYYDYWKGSWSHNTVSVDDMTQNRFAMPPEPRPDPDRRFVRGDGFDYARSWYRGPYTPLPSHKRTEASGESLPAGCVQHQRCVFYVKGSCALICDRMVGEGTHQVDVNFRPSPVAEGTGLSAKVRPVQLERLPDGGVVTVEPARANVAIVPIGDAPTETLVLLGQKDPLRGWFAWNGIQPSHEVVFRYQGALPRHTETLVQPLSPGHHKPLACAAEEIAVDGEKTCAALRCGEALFLLSYDGPATMRCGTIEFQGTALWLQPEVSGATLVYMVDGRKLSVDGREVFATRTPVSARTLRFSSAGRGDAN